MPYLADPDRKTMFPETLKLDQGKMKSSQVAFWIPKCSSNNLDDLGKLSKDYAEVHLFFYLNGNMNKLMWCDSDTLEREMNRMPEIEWLVVVPPGYLIKSENVIDSLLVDAAQNASPFKKIEPIGNLILLKREDIEHLPSTFASNIKINSTKIDLNVAQTELGIHLRRGFDKIFLFNTESYKDIEVLNNKIGPAQIIGFSSGFKMNKIAHHFGSDKPDIVFVDSNLKSLQFKSELVANWDGKNLPSYLQAENSNNFQFSEKNPGLIDHLWERELRKWEGSKNFAGLWERFQVLSTNYIHIDLIEEAEKFFSGIEQKENVVLWISNMWHNEFVHFKYGPEVLFSLYKKWMKSLLDLNQKITILQSEVLTPSGLYYGSGKNIVDICHDLESLS